LLTFSGLRGYDYTLPDDPLWPTAQQVQDFKDEVDGYLYPERSFVPRLFSSNRGPPLPGYVFVPENVSDIKEGVKFAKDHKMRISVSSTGHHQDMRNIADNTFHFDMRKFTDLDIDVDDKYLETGTGNNFDVLFPALKTASNGTLTMVSGTCPSVGIYGWSVGGGYSFLNKLYGLGVDNLLEAELVTADGDHITVNEEDNSDLYWALRGGAGSAWGVVTKLKIRLHDDTGKWYSKKIIFPGTQSNYKKVIEWTDNAPATCNALYKTAFPIGSGIEELNAVCTGDETTALNELAKIPDFECSPSPCTVTEKTYDGAYEYIDHFEFPKGILLSISAGSAIEKKDALSYFDDLHSWLSTQKITINSHYCLNFGILGGVAGQNDPDRSQTSVSQALRKGDWYVNCMVNKMPTQTQDEFDKAVMDLQDYGNTIYPKYAVDNFIYWNDALHTHSNGNDWKERYWGGLDNYNRLLQVKQKYDPDNTFTCYHCVGWNLDDTTEPVICPKNDCSCSNNPNGECVNYNSVDLINLVDGEIVITEVSASIFYSASLGLILFIFALLLNQI